MEKGIFFVSCTFSSDEYSDYTTLVTGENVSVFENEEKIYDFALKDISGAVYFNDVVYYTKNESNCLYIKNLKSGTVDVIEFEFEVIKVMKYVNFTKQNLIIEIDGNYTILYDCFNKKKVFELPIKKNFIDFTFIKNNEAIMLGEDKKNISVYADDLDYEYIIMCNFIYDGEGKVDIIDQLSVAEVCVDTVDDLYSSIPNSITEMKIPLFEYVEGFLEHKSLSTYGEYVVWYYEEEDMIIISHVKNGNIHIVFFIPFKHEENDFFYYNEKTNIFTIVTDDFCVKQYYLKRKSIKEVEWMNFLYNEIYLKKDINKENNENIRKYKKRDFERIFYTSSNIDFIGRSSMSNNEFLYDVALSFSGEDRRYVEEVAIKLKEKGIRVFYDKFEVSNLWGKDLYQYLNKMYKDNAKYCVLFISKFYKTKLWTNHELHSAQNRAFHENEEYILPILIEEGVDLEGFNDTVGFIKASDYSIEDIVDFIIDKLDN